MVFKRKAKARRFFGGFKRKAARRSNKGGILGGLTGDTGKMLSAGAYGAVREKGAQLISPVTAKLPLGGIADEVGMIILMGLTKKVIKNPMVRDIATAGQLIEAAQIGQALAKGQLNLGNSTTGTASSGGYSF